jgi:hypothetical protein
MTDEQVARRRKIERTAQRNARAKTKARIKELERLVESFQSTHGDERLENVVNMLMQQQEQGRKLRSFLREIHRLINDNGPLWLETLPNAVSNDELNQHHQLSDPGSTAIQQQPTNRSVPDPELSCSHNLVQCAFDNFVDIGPGQKGVPVWRSVDNALEVAVQHLHQQKQSLQGEDVDIAIRAIADGWTNVKSAHSLDMGWLTLRKIDQTLFYDCSPMTRLAILRAMRLNMLVSLVPYGAIHCVQLTWHRSRYPVATWILSYLLIIVRGNLCYCIGRSRSNKPSPAQQMIQHPLLVDFFPW